MRASLGRKPEASTVTVTTWTGAALDARDAWEGTAGPGAAFGVIVVPGLDADFVALLLHAGRASAASIAASTRASFLPMLIFLSILSVLLPILIPGLIPSRASDSNPSACSSGGARMQGASRRDSRRESAAVISETSRQCRGLD